MCYGKNPNLMQLSWGQIIQCVFFQKCLRINSRTNWPVHFTSQVKAPDLITPGSRFPGLSIGCYIDGRNGIIIKDNVWIGPGTKIISMNHNRANMNNYEKAEPIRIGSNVWIGAGSIILPGVSLPDDCIVAAGSVVTKSVPKNAKLVAGVPAKMVK